MPAVSKANLSLSLLVPLCLGFASLAHAQFNAKLNLNNKTDHDVDILFVQENGNEKLLGTLKAGETRSQNTNIGTEFVARNPKTKGEVGRLTVSQADGVLEIPPEETPINVTFTNKTNGVVNIFWNNRGQEEAYGSIKPGESQKRQTFSTHQWVFRHGTNNNIVLSATTSVEGQVVQIGGGRKKPDPIKPVDPPNGGQKGSLTPVDAGSAARYPSILPLVNSDGGLDVAWTSSQGAIYLSSFSGNDWSAGRTVPVNGSLNILAGFTKDGEGNSLVLSAKSESVVNPAPAFRRGILQIHKLSGNSSQLFADLNSQEHIFENDAAVFNPLGDQQRNTGTSRMVFAHNHVVPMWTQNWSRTHQRGNVIALDTNGANRYNRGGYWDHCADLKMLADGQEVVIVQANENGLGISKLNLEAATWSGIQRLAVSERKHDSRLRIGGLAKTDHGYLIAYAYGKDGSGSSMWDPQDNEVPSKEDVYVMTVPANITDNGLTVDRIRQIGPYIDSLAVPRTVVAQKLVDYSSSNGDARRINFVDLTDGKYLLVWEKWKITDWLGANGGYSPNWGAYESTYAMLVDATGRQIAAPKDLGAVRIQKNTDAVYFPQRQLAGWLAGDAANNRLLLHTVDASLNLRTTPLPLNP